MIYLIKMVDKIEILFKKKPMLILTTLLLDEKARYGTVLAKKTDCTYSHTVKILNTLNKLKLIEFEKRGRIKLIKLTNKGRQVAEYVRKIESLVS